VLDVEVASEKQMHRATASLGELGRQLRSKQRLKTRWRHLVQVLSD
jgi:hypothetical protein